MSYQIIFVFETEVIFLEIPETVGSEGQTGRPSVGISDSPNYIILVAGKKCRKAKNGEYFFHIGKDLFKYR